MADVNSFIVPAQANWTSAGEVDLTLPGYKVAFIGFLPATGTIEKIAFANSVAGTGSCNVTIEGISGIDPDGVPVATATNVSYTGLGGEIIEATLDVPYSGTASQRVAIVITQNDTASLNVLGWAASPVFLNYGTFVREQTGGGWVNGIRSPGVSLFYQSDRWRQIGYGVAPRIIADANINTGSSPNEYGISFEVPFGVSIGGFSAFYENDVDPALQWILYNDSTVLDSITTSTADRITTAVGTGLYPLNQVHDLVPGNTYRLTMKPSVASGAQLKMSNFIVTSDILGDTIIKTQRKTFRTGDGAWSEDVTKIPVIGLAVTAIDAGGGGGGNVIVVEDGLRY